MSIREDVELYTKLSGEDGSQETIGTIGAYLRGYRQGKENAEPHSIKLNQGQSSDMISRQQAIDEMKQRRDSAKEWYDETDSDDIRIRADSAIASFIECILTLKKLPSAEPQIIRCKDCKYRMPYDWMFSETWQSQNIDDYPEDEIGCLYCDMAMKADDYCSRAERRENEP